MTDRVTDFISLTPLAEYVEMLYVRLGIEMPKHEQVTRWWVELHPPVFTGEDVGAGFVEIRGRTKDKVLSYRATMHAVQQGAKVSTEILETVVEHHINRFIKALA